MEHLKLSFKNFSDLLQVIPTDNEARMFLEELRWCGTPVCPHCGTQNPEHYKLKVKGEFKGLYKCKDCKERFTVTVGTMFEGSHIGLRKWFIAMYIFSSHKKGISSLQLGRDLGITQKPAWFMLSIIRNSFKPQGQSKLSGTVQCDESFIGGKEANKHANKKTKDTQGRSTKKKTPVFGLLSDGKVNTEVVTDTKASTLKPIIMEMVETGAIVVTDEWGAYNGLNANFKHEVVKHNEGKYVSNGLSTNGLEGFWSLLKRGIFGIYHQVSPKHLNKYCDEFTYRYNTRTITDSERFVFSLFIAKERMTYKALIA
jgi:transposase-like protein